jgi:hypothetical protein
MLRSARDLRNRNSVRVPDRLFLRFIAVGAPTPRVACQKVTAESLRWASHPRGRHDDDDWAAPVC